MLKKIFLGVFLLVPFIAGADQKSVVDHQSSSSTKEQNSPTAASIKWLDPRIVQPGYIQVLPMREKALKRAIRRMKKEEAQVNLNKNERTRSPYHENSKDHINQRNYGRVQIHHEDRETRAHHHKYRRIQNNHKKYRKSQFHPHKYRRVQNTHMKVKRSQKVPLKPSPCSDHLKGSSPDLCDIQKDHH